MKKKKHKGKKKGLLVILTISIIFILVVTIFFLSKPKYSTNKFLKVIKEDKEVKEFIDELQRSDMKEIEITKTKLARRDILIEQYGSYKNEYKDLPLDREEIYKVELVTEKREMVIIVDMENEEVLSSYGILNVRMQ